MGNIPKPIDINFIRAQKILEKRIHTPEYLINLWRLLPYCHFSPPTIETVKPWYKGLENLIS